MKSQTLWEARRYEEVREKEISEQERPAFHLQARVGWMNDPNGFSLYKGQIHLFYQYYPYATHWGPMHWAHAVSRDLLHWETLPAALAPDSPYDCGGCFSGSAIELPDGRQLLMYTGVRHEIVSGHTKREIQTQCIAVGDGVNYDKYDGNPVLDESDLPAGASRIDFRDPKLWREADGSYTCVVGSRPADGSGQLLLYTSPDAFHWTFKSVLAENRNRFGKMWECPDLFRLDGKWVILTSPQDMLPDGFEYPNGNGTLCLIGDYDPQSGKFSEQCDQAVDYGIDFYAPQTLLLPDGRRVMIAWMQNWDCCASPPKEKKWFGQMTLPRELSIRNGRLYQKPIRELETLRRGRVLYEDVILNGERSLQGVSGRTLDIEIELWSTDSACIYKKFAVRFAQNATYRTALSFRPYEGVLNIDRKFSGTRRNFVHQRRAKVGGHDGHLKLRLILDRYSAEVFVNDGAQVLSITMDTELSAEGITFFADGTVRMRVEKYELKA